MPQLLNSSWLVFRLLWPLVLAAAPSTAEAELRIKGNVQSMTVEAIDAPLEEVLADLSAAFNMAIRTSMRLDIRVSGTYRGPLQEVVGRLLADQDYVIKYAPAAVEVTIIGPSNRGPVIPSSSAMVSAGPAMPLDEPDLRRSPKAIRKDAGRNTEDIQNAVAERRAR
jgi:hypothetical protein